MSNRIELGIETDNPGNYQTRLNKRELKLAEAVREDQNIEDTFQQALAIPAMDQADGTAYTGAAAEVLAVNSGKAMYEVYQAAVATPAVVTPYQSASGLELKPVAAADALELTNGTTALSRAAYTVGASSKTVFCEATIKIDDISDVTEAFFGFRKAEAYQADPDNYDEMASIHVGDATDGQIEIHTILNGGATSETDTTLTDWADAAEKTLRIEVNQDGVCKFFVDDAEPTVTASFTFDANEVIVPFLHLNTETGDPGLSISSWKVGYM